MPKIYSVNWFLKKEDDSFLWPGFGENCRVLEWIFQRVESPASCKESFLGFLPEDLNLEGLDIQNKEELFPLDKEAWLKETKQIDEYFRQFGDKLPKELLEEVKNLEKRILS